MTAEPTQTTTIAHQIVSDAMTKVYPFSCVIGALHDKRVSNHVDQKNLIDVYTFEDGSQIALRLEVIDSEQS